MKRVFCVMIESEFEPSEEPIDSELEYIAQSITDVIEENDLMNSDVIVYEIEQGQSFDGFMGEVKADIVALQELEERFLRKE